jgi:DegV family protein with EDD domain
VFFGEEALLDGVDIDAPAFYERLRSSHVLPRTSQPSVELFRTAYEELGTETEEIVSIHISSRLSGTLNAASVAREDVSHTLRIELIDSYNVSLGLAHIVLEAADVAVNGGKLEDVVAAARRAMDRTKVVVVVDTLEYLHRGGRIGRARSLLGSVLSIKPLLQVHDGEVAPFERVRTRARAIERLHELATGEARARRMFIGMTGDDPAADSLVERLRPALPHTDIAKAFLGPIVGVYTGPNALGIASIERE